MTARPKARPFVQVPLDWATAAAVATRSPKTAILIELLYAAWKANGEPVTLPSGRLERVGVGRHIRRRCLVELAEAGLVTIERRPGRPFLVRVVLP
jgi:hypothetical protein